MRVARVELRRLADGVKARINLPELASQLGLARRGKLWRCPWHEDVTPSLSIREQSSRCFGCAQTGDAITLLRKLIGWDFSDALYFLAVREVCWWLHRDGGSPICGRCHPPAYPEQVRAWMPQAACRSRGQPC